jgi:hypothetical protein
MQALVNLPATPQAVYNPAPPVKPNVKRSTGCLGMFGVLVVAAAAATSLAAAFLR